MTDPEFSADHVRKMLDRIHEHTFEHTDDVQPVLEQFANEIVEDGTLTPDSSVTITLSLTPKERVDGTREQDVTALLSMGMMLGSALERDVPANSDREELWRDGQFYLPESGGYE